MNAKWCLAAKTEKAKKWKVPTVRSCIHQRSCCTFCCNFKERRERERRKRERERGSVRFSGVQLQSSSLLASICFANVLKQVARALLVCKFTFLYRKKFSSSWHCQNNKLLLKLVLTFYSKKQQSKKLKKQKPTTTSWSQRRNQNSKKVCSS